MTPFCEVGRWLPFACVQGGGEMAAVVPKTGGGQGGWVDSAWSRGLDDSFTGIAECGGKKTRDGGVW